MKGDLGIEGKKDYLCKVVIIGEPCTGKTSLLRRFTTDKFDEKYTVTLGVDFQIKMVAIDNCLIKLQLWDTDGQEKYKMMTKAYYKNAKACIIMYDVTRRSTFEKVEIWLKQFQEVCDPSQTVIIIVGNKIDLINDRQTHYDEGNALALQYSVPFREISVKDNYDAVKELFTFIARKGLELCKKEDIGKQIEGHKEDVHNKKIQLNAGNNSVDQRKHACFC